MPGDSGKCSALYTISARVRMEPGNRHLADEYVQHFVLDHLEDVAVKREDKRQMIETENWLQQDDSSNRICRSQWDDRRMLSPPPDFIYDPQPTLVNISLINDPGTPPDTPPNHSPPLPCRPPIDDMMWFSQSMSIDPQPLDLRPIHCMGGEPDWEHGGYIPSGMILDVNNHHDIHQRPQSVCSTANALSTRLNNDTSGYSTCSEDIGLNDDLLMSLPIKELNKRLHGSPREEIEKLKRQRRTLKNRVYAQNCRSRRTLNLQDLEQTNESLQQKLHRLKSELVKVTQERDLLRHKVQLGRYLSDSGIGSSLNSSLNSDGQSSPEFYL